MQNPRCVMWWMSGILVKASGHRILVISVYAIIINRIFARDHCESVTMEPEGKEEEKEKNIRQR